MSYTRRRSNGTGYSNGHTASIVRAIRGDLPPPAGVRWRLDEKECHAELTTSHPILGARKHELRVTAGTLEGSAKGQFELALGFACDDAVDAAETIGVVFRSAAMLRPETFRYLAKGELSVGEATAITVIRIHDLSWIMGQDPDRDTRALTIAATLDRRLLNLSNGAIPTPWLTRNEAEVFFHTEWVVDRGGPAAA